MPLIPYVVEKNGQQERAYDIYSRLLKDRIIFLGTAVNDEVANSIASWRHSAAATAAGLPATDPMPCRLMDRTPKTLRSKRPR